MRGHLTLAMGWTLTFTALIILAGCSNNRKGVTTFLQRDQPQENVTTPQPKSKFCSIFQDEVWQEFRFGEDSAKEVIHTATLLWQNLNESQINSYELYGDDLTWAVQWLARTEGAKIRYTAEGSEERKLVSFHVELYPGATLAQVFDCLGPPQYYAAEIPPDFVNGLRLALVYVDEGFRFSGLTHGGKEQPKAIQPDFRLNYFDVVPSGDLKKMISHLASPILHAYFLCELRPWAGSLEEIIIDSFFDENPRCAE